MFHKFVSGLLLIFFCSSVIFVSAVQSEESDESQLLLSAPLSVVEGSSFTVSVLANGTPVEKANVYFGDMSGETNEQGLATLSAPTVDADASFTLLVTHESFLSAQKTITVFNQREQTDKGWIYGQVYQSNGNGIKTAHVCVVLSSVGSTSSCVFTDSDGRYDLLVPVGEYQMVVTKQGYESQQRSSVQVVKNEAVEQNFLLVSSSDIPSGNSQIGENRDLIEAAINTGISADLVGGQIDIAATDKSYDITLYKDELIVDVIFVNESEVRFTVDAEDISDTIIALRLTNPEDTETIEVLFDDEQIEQIDFVDIFQLGDSSSSAHYAKLAIEDEQGRVLYCLVFVPEFSVHEITIRSLSELIEGLSGVSAVLIYTATGLSVFCVLLAPLVVNIFRRRRLL